MASGMEIMLKSMGLGNVLEMAQELATNGTLEKILKFSDDMETMQATLARMEKAMNDAGIIETGPDRDGLSDATRQSLRKLLDDSITD